MIPKINILSKNPDNSNCKSRLKSLLSYEERIFLSKKMLTMICDEFSCLEAHKSLHLYPNINGGFVERLSKDYSLNLVQQSTGHLSTKIYSALNSYKNIDDKRIVIGSDIPSISKREFYDCIEYLNSYEMVIGPSRDHGFYLVGCKGDAHKVFKNMNLNTILLANLINICSEKSINFILLRTLKDIDEPKDLLTL